MPASTKAFLSFIRTGTVAPDQLAARPKLYCFAYAGGTSSIFAPWARALASRVTVLGVELPGHGSRFQEAPLETVAEMAECAAEAWMQSDNDAPFAFYGHSLGAVVAYETARLVEPVRRAGQPSLRHLFVGAARAPHLPPAVPAISHLPQSEFLNAVQNRYGGLPAALFEEPELLEMVLPVLRADFKAYEAYRSSDTPSLCCPVTAFYGIHDPVVRAAAVGEWARVTGNSFHLQEVDGDHFFLNTQRDRILTTIGENLAHLHPPAASTIVSPHFSTSQETY